MASHVPEVQSRSRLARSAPARPGRRVLGEIGSPYLALELENGIVDLVLVDTARVQSVNKVFGRKLEQLRDIRRQRPLH